LTVTWLLPVALIPGTWEVNGVPTSHSTTGAHPATGALTSDLNSA